MLATNMLARQAFRPVISLPTTFIRCQSSSLLAAAAAAPKQARLTPWLAGAFVAGAAFFVLRPQHVNHVAKFNKAREALKDAPKVFTGEKDQGFVNLKLVESRQVNHNTRELRFAFDDASAVSGLNVASAVLAKLQPPASDSSSDSSPSKPVIRPYTPTSTPETRGSLTLLVKQYPNGPMSTHMHSLQPGDSLAIKGPIPKYPISQDNQYAHLAMIAGGTGITPMYQLIRRIFDNPNERTKISLVYANVSEADVLLRQELQDLEMHHPSRFKVVYTLDKPGDKWQGQTGFITKDMLKRSLPTPDEPNTKVFVCGPPPMYNAVSGPKKSPSDQGDLTGYLQELGYSKDQVFKF